MVSAEYKAYSHPSGSPPGPPSALPRTSDPGNLSNLSPPNDFRPSADRIAINGVEFDNVTMLEAVACILDMVKSGGRPHMVCTGNLDHLVMLARDREFHRIYREADLVLADGAPIVWLSRLAISRGRNPLIERVAGSDLFWELAAESGKSGIRLFFLGGKPTAAEAAADVVRKQYPNVQICGAYCPPFEEFATEAEQERIRAIIRAANPDILMVGLGAPKQEKWIAENMAALDVPVSIGVGGTFEMAAGQLRRAPVWMRRFGLEWVFRFLQEPGRLFKRYFIQDVPFLALLTARMLLSRRRLSRLT